MKLRFLGTGAAFAPQMGNTGAFFTRGDDFFMIDCGEQAFAKLHRSGLLSRYTGALTVAMTHLHADHCGALGTLSLYAAQVLGRPLTIVYPGEKDVRTLLSLMGAQAGHYTVTSGYDARGLVVRPMPAMHVPAIAAFSYLLTDEDGAIYYSGDSATLPPDILAGVRGNDIAHAYVDVSLFDTPPVSPAHLPFDTLCALVEPPLRKRFTLMHFNRDFHEKIHRDGFLCAEMDPIFG